MAHVNAPLSVHRFRNNVSAHSLHDEDGGKKFSFPRTMIKNHQDCKTAATSTTCHFAHQRRLEHEFSQPAGMSYEKLPNLPKIVVKYPHRHESSARIHDSLQANAMHYENTCAERFIYKFSGDDVKQNWTKCTQTTTSFVSLLQGHARGKPPDAQEESELQVHERKHKCQHLSLSFNKCQRLLSCYPQVCDQVHQQGEDHWLSHELHNKTNVWSSIRRAREKQSVLMSF